MLRLRRAGPAKAEVRFGLRAVVQAEDADDDSFEFLGDHDRSGPPAITSAVGMVVFGELDAKGLAHLLDCARQPHAPARRARMRHGKVVGSGEIRDLGDVFVQTRRGLP